MTNNEIKNKIIELFFIYFKDIKGYQDWSDNEILFNYNDDDIKDFLNFIQKTLKNKEF